MWLEVTTLLIPGLNDSDAEIDVLSRFVSDRLGPDVPLHVTAFHPDWRLRDRPPTPPATLTRARRIAIANGLHHVYTGNVRDPEGQSMWCHACGALLIGRNGYDVGAWLSDRGRPVPELRRRARRRLRSRSRRLRRAPDPGRDRSAVIAPRKRAAAGHFYPADAGERSPTTGRSSSTTRSRSSCRSCSGGQARACGLSRPRSTRARPAGFPLCAASWCTRGARGWAATLLRLGASADSGGGTAQVVGYGAFGLAAT